MHFWNTSAVLSAALDVVAYKKLCFCYKSLKIFTFLRNEKTILEILLSRCRRLYELMPHTIHLLQSIRVLVKV